MSNPMPSDIRERPESTRCRPSSFVLICPQLRTKADILRIFLLCHPMRRAWLLGRRTMAEGTDSVSENVILGCTISHRPTFPQDLCRKTRAIAMIETDPLRRLRDYIACLNKQDWPKLERFRS